MDTNLMIVGLGASAGGIDALRRFFEHVPNNSGMAYVVILHLSPEHDSRLAEVLQSAASIPVTQVQERVRVRPNRVYVIAPGRSLSMSDGHLELSDITHIEERRAPVDIFFRTLAETHGSRAVGVVLSGTGVDGSMGLKRIKEGGGICIAQDPADAQYPDMPRAAIATGVVDHVLPAGAIPQKIQTLRAHLNAADLADPSSEQTNVTEDALREVFAQLRAGTGHNFADYKRSTVLRRIGRRMAVSEVAEVSDYSEILRTRPGELQALLQDLLISVTHFFRDREVFEYLQREVIGKLFEGKGPEDSVRAWVAACATGEEAYSIAMLLSEQADSIPQSGPIQVFATDLDARSVGLARLGFYTTVEAADVSAERLDRFFLREENGYRVRPQLRERVLFSQHNVIKDPPFSHLDLVSCRNLLIYLNRTAQRRVLELLHFALRPGRFLLLGSSESIEAATDLFEVVDKTACVFAARAHTSRVGLPVPEGRVPAAVQGLAVRPVAHEPPVRPPLGAALHHRLLEEYAPPSLVVDSHFDILHLSERVGRYLQIGGGAPSRNLMTVLRPELRTEVRTALVQAGQQQIAVEANDLALSIDGEVTPVSVLVKPILLEESAGYLVLFRALEPGAAPESVVPVRVLQDEVTRQLEEEVIQLREQLRLTEERYELHVEDHKASLEEQHAMNEELRSASEELETGREELQSLNEELQTVNQELKNKVDEQAHANDNMRNLVDATDIGTIFLDRNLRVTLFTPAAQRVFYLLPGDRGRPLSDINTALIAVPVDSDVQDVMRTLERIEREVQTRDGRWLLMRIHPYRTSDDRINGLVLTFVDVTERRAIEQRIQVSEERLRRATLVDNVGIMFFRADGAIVDANDAFLRITGLTRAEIEQGQHRWQDLASGETQAAALAAAKEFARTGRTAPYEREQRRPDGTHRWGLCAATRLTPDEGVEFVVDITTTKTTESRLHLSESRHRLMVENITEYAVFTMDDQGCVDHWNPGAERIFGYSESEIVGRSVSVLFTPEDRAASVDTQELQTARDQGRASDDRWHLRKDGSRLFVAGVTTPLRDATGRSHGFVKVARDLTDRKRFEEALQGANDALEKRVEERTSELATANRTLDGEVMERRAAEQQIRRLLVQMLSIQEAERSRIARDLHDHIGQQLVALRMRLDVVGNSPGVDGALAVSLEEAQRGIGQLDRDVDFFASELRPPTLDHLGLIDAIRRFVSDWSKTFGISADLHAEGFGNERLSVDAETHLYRIAQEALNNVYKHAQATTVSVLLERRRAEVVLIVEDDGRGFEGAAAMDADVGMGLIGMRERAGLIGGTFQIESVVGAGTTVYVRVPAATTATSLDPALN